MRLKLTFRDILKCKFWQKVDDQIQWNEESEDGSYFSVTFVDDPENKINFDLIYSYSYHDIQEKLK